MKIDRRFSGKIPNFIATPWVNSCLFVGMKKRQTTFRCDVNKIEFLVGQLIGEHTSGVVAGENKGNGKM